MGYGAIHCDVGYLRDRAEQVHRILREQKVTRIVGSGTSGLIMITALRLKGHTAAYVRKGKWKSHSPGTIECDDDFCYAIADQRVAVIDDFVATGNTMKRIFGEFYDYFKRIPDLVIQYDAFHTTAKSLQLGLWKGTTGEPTGIVHRLNHDVPMPPPDRIVPMIGLDEFGTHYAPQLED